MTEPAQFWNRAANAAVAVARFALYPLHCVIRILARLVLLTLVLAAIPVPPMIMVILIMSVASMVTGGAVSNPLAWVADLLTQEGEGSAAIPGEDTESGEGKESATEGGMWALIAGTATALTSAGVVSILIQRSLDDILKSVSGVGAHLRTIGKGPWLPGLEVGKSLAGSWKGCIARIPAEVRETLVGSTRLFFVLMFTFVLAFLAYEPIREVEEGIDTLEVISTAVTQVSNSTNVTQQLLDIQNTLKADPRVLVIPPDGAVDDVWKTHLEEKLDELRASILTELQGQPRNIALVAWGDAAATPIEFPAGTVFSLVYPPQGDLNSPYEGICPDQANQQWLNLFKDALVACSRDGPLKVTVTGFSSIAPVSKGGVYNLGESNQFNCEIANRRAEAVAYFLASGGDVGGATETEGQWCSSFLNGGRGANAMCTGDGQVKAWDEQNDPDLHVSYRTWGSFVDMTDQKPSNDGTGSERRPQLEPLNRVVQIVVEEPVCW